MARFSRIQVATKMQETGLVPVFYNKDLEVCKKVLKACYEGGVRVFEFTNRGEFANEVFNELCKYAAKELPELILGAGSIVEEGTASIYMQSGANFIVSPILNERMAYTCNRRKVLWSPGCGSLSEISRAEELGAEIVKIFPGSEVGGPSFVKGVRAPLPWTSIMPTGGVAPTEENLSAWFQAGVVCVGMGSKLFTKEIMGSGDYKGLEEKVKETIEIIEKVRS